MKIATFNANSVRARLPILIDWLESEQPDVLGVQETKVEDDKFPHEAFEEIGYVCTIHGQKSYNGVAFVSKMEPTGVFRGFNDPTFPEDARVLGGAFKDVTIINTYVPNGNTVGSEKFEYKKRWLEKFKQFVGSHFSPAQPVVWMGDINIAPKPEDVYDSKKVLGGVGHHPDEFSRLEAIVDWGFKDLFRAQNQEAGQFTFWEFVIRNAVEKNIGWRIDHIYGTAPVLQNLEKVWIDKAPRLLERPSDHTFVICELTEKFTV